ncbi:MAG: hypothetical protein GY756_16225 [bacterium]|nr:hypothetical protein [bacterium]
MHFPIVEQFSPVRTRVFQAMCDEITVHAAKFPGTELRIVFRSNEGL